LIRSGVTAPSFDATKVKKAVDETKQFAVPAKEGIADCSIIMNASAMQLSENVFSDLNTKGMSAKRVTQEFVSAATKAIANRVFVNSVIPFIA
jgi:hypothetical protein